MRKTALILPFLAAAIISCNSTTTTDTTKKTDSTTVAAAPAKDTTAPAPAMDSATMAKNAMAYMAPGDMHKLLASVTGTWTEDMTMWMDASKPPMKSMATCEIKMIMGGRYQQLTSKGNMMGMQFEGLSTTAYDNARKVFINTWIDNGGTGLAIIEGPYDSTTKTTTMKGKMVDPSTGKNIDIKETIQYVDAKTMLMTMYMTGGSGKEAKSMEVKLTKK